MYFPGDPLFAHDPIFNSVPDPKARERHDRAVRPGPDRAGVGARLRVGHRAARPERDRLRDGGPTGEPAPHAVADGRPVPGHRPAVGRTGRSWSPRGRQARSRSPDASSTRRENPCPTRWSRRGRPTPSPGSTTRTTRGARPRRAIAGFRGFGRSATDADGGYRIVTVRPGPLPSPAGGTEAPHLDVSVFARGLLDRVVTRIYFADEAEANAADPVLSAIAEPERRETLLASPDGQPGGGGRVPLRHQAARRTRDRLLRCLTTSPRPQSRYRWSPRSTGAPGAPVLVLGPLARHVPGGLGPPGSRARRALQAAAGSSCPAMAARRRAPGPYTIAELGAGVRALLDQHGVERGRVLRRLPRRHDRDVAGGHVARADLGPRPDLHVRLPAAGLWLAGQGRRRSRPTGMASVTGQSVGRWFTPAFVRREPGVAAAFAADLERIDPAGYAGCCAAIARHGPAAVSSAASPRRPWSSRARTIRRRRPRTAR